MPSNNLCKSGAHQASYSTKQEEILSIPNEQQMLADRLADNIFNAIYNATRSQSPSVVRKNFKYLQERLSSSLGKQISFKLYDQNQVNYQELKLRIKAPEVSSDVPIFLREDIKDTIGLSEPLLATLQKSEECTTILNLLQVNFPKLTSSFFNKETKIPRFIVSSPIPLNQEGKGNFFPQIESEGQVAYIAWDSSGSQIAKGFKEKTCDILLKNKEAFCGVGLSQADLEEIEEGAGVSDHFITSKVTVIGILVAKPLTYIQSWWLNGGIIACDSDSDEDSRCSDVLIARGPLSRSDPTTFGMLGIQGATVSSHLQNLPDRPKKLEETLYPFCLEIVPQFSSKQNPVKEEDLVMAVEALLQ